MRIVLYWYLPRLQTPAKEHKIVRSRLFGRHRASKCGTRTTGLQISTRFRWLFDYRPTPLNRYQCQPYTTTRYGELFVSDGVTGLSLLNYL